ncbi:ATP-grasp domain-containing protein [Streptomyces sp. NBC_01615]|uniref:ATP-grasp domain-containing protein n=1 Tax=Streptomyces sp. NBC_01615 TaxID=2975898 RepID=UPI003863A319
MTSATPTPVIAVIESQLSDFGLTPLRAAHELGYRAVLVSNDPDRYRAVSTADEVYAKYIDGILTADTNSAEAVIEALTPFHTEGVLRGVMTVTDYNIPIVARIAAHFGLPGMDVDAAAACRDKLVQREMMRAAGVAVPRFTQAVTQEDALAAAEEFGLPVVVKPMTESASIGVSLCRTPEEVAAAHHAIASVPLNFRGQPRRPGALVEEYLIGYELSAEIVHDGTEHRVIGLTDKALGPHPYFAELGEIFPSVLSEPVRTACADLVISALRAVGHDFGAAHVEVKVTQDGPYIVEINGRMAGAEIPRLILESTGIHMQREVTLLHAGRPADLTPTQDRAAVSRYLTASTAGVLAGVEGADLARRVPGVVAVVLHPKNGKPVKPAQSNLDYLGTVVATADTAGDALRCADAAVGQLTPVVVAEAEGVA